MELGPNWTEGFMSEQKDWIAIRTALLSMCAAIERKYIGTPKKTSACYRTRVDGKIIVW
jgi:hypothetical protein